VMVEVVEPRAVSGTCPDRRRTRRPLPDTRGPPLVIDALPSRLTARQARSPGAQSHTSAPRS
jgi:hypothetical protein